MRNRITRVAFGAVMAVAAAASLAVAQDAAVKADDQALSNDTLIVASVKTPADGFIAVHRLGKDGKMNPTANGYVAVKKGDNVNVTVPMKFKTKPKAGAKFIVVLHEDSDKIGKFQFNQKNQSVDKPMMVGDQMVAAAIKLL
jgi:hypothetical protein